jgi:hypothetical protein
MIHPLSSSITSSCIAGNLGREQWLGGVLSACDALGFRAVISRHPADNVPAKMGAFSDRAVTDLLRGASVVVTRPSTVIFEAMAARKPVVVFPTHGEPLGEFAKPMRAFQVVHSETELGPAIERALRGKTEYWSRCREFFDDHVSVETGRPASVRVAERLLAFQRALHGGDDRTGILPLTPRQGVDRPPEPVCPSCGSPAELVDGSRLYLRAEASEEILDLPAVRLASRMPRGHECPSRLAGRSHPAQGTATRARRL